MLIKSIKINNKFYVAIMRSRSEINTFNKWLYNHGIRTYINDEIMDARILIKEIGGEVEIFDREYKYRIFRTRMIDIATGYINLAGLFIMKPVVICPCSYYSPYVVPRAYTVFISRFVSRYMTERREISYINLPYKNI